MAFTISNAGTALIKQCEGCKLTAYRDKVGVPTIGYGHTSGVHIGQVISQAQADAFLRQDLRRFEKYVNNPKYVPQTYQLNQNQFDALVSFAFNLGQKNLKSLCKKGRTLAQIAQHIPNYKYAGGVVLPGLVQRRAREVALFNAPVNALAPAPTQAPAPTGHNQLNYQAGKYYGITCSALKVRTKPSLNGNQVVLGKEIDRLVKGSLVKNRATMRLENQIFMYIGLDNKGRERWVCADNGSATYIS